MTKLATNLILLFMTTFAGIVTLGKPIYADLRGSDALLAKLEAKAEQGSSGEKSEAVILHQALEDFAHKMGSQSAEKNGETWTALLLDMIDLGRVSGSDQLLTYDLNTNNSLSVNSVLSVLPPPESWPFIVIRLKSAAQGPDFKPHQRAGLSLLAAGSGE